MTTHRLIDLLLAAAGVTVWMLLGSALDGPSELDAIQATADSVTDAQNAAVAAHHANQIAQVKP